MYRTILFLGAMAIPVVANAQNQSAEDLFIQALQVERVSSNPEAAVALYRQIVEMPSADRQLVARAWLQMGKAFEVLGEDGARQAYSRVVSDFGDMREVAREAEERMAGLAGPLAQTAEQSEFKTYMLSHTTWGNSMPSGMYGAAPSHSGNLLAREGPDGGMTIDNLLDGTQQNYSQESLGCPSVYTMRFSPDDRYVAFGCWTDTAGMVLKLLDRNVDETRLLTTGAKFLSLPDSLHFEIEVYDWTLDGRFVLASIEGADLRGRGDPSSPRKHQVALVPVGNDDPVVIDPEYNREDRYFREMNACLMMDESLMLAEYAVEEGEEWRVDIRVTEISTGTERILLGEPSADYELFGCDRTLDVVYYSRQKLESRHLYVADLSPGGALVNQRELRSVPADSDPVMSQNGDLYFTEATRRLPATLEAPIDPLTGDLTGTVKKIDDGWANAIAYTLGGQLVWASSRAGATFLRSADGAQSVVSGTQERTRRVWDLAGEDLLVWSMNAPSGSKAALLIDGETGAPKDTLDAYRMSPNLRTLYRRDGDCLNAFSRDSGETRRVFCLDPERGSVTNVSVDPISGCIAYGVRDDDDEIWIVDPETGRSALVTTRKWASFKWAGGKLFIRSSGTAELLRYDPETDELAELPTFEQLSDVATRIMTFAISQDLKRLAVTATLNRGDLDVELFVIRNPGVQD